MTGRTAHTPGPWIVARGDSVYARRDTGPMPPIADMAQSRTVTKAEAAANARLIAAAPAMLRTLHLIAQHAENAARTFPNAVGRGDLIQIAADARAAIAAATGGEG